MKTFLIDMFQFNLEANTRMVHFARDLDYTDEIWKHLSHLANSQYKWLDRILIFPGTSTLDWWDPVYDPDVLISKMKESTSRWIEFLSSCTNEEIENERSYVGYDGDIWQAKLKDIALQLTFHSFHHRAQIQMMIRSQGKAPEFIDYIGYKAQKKK